MCPALGAHALAGAQAPCWLSGRRGERDEGERRGPKSSPPCTCGRFHAATGSLGDPCGGAGRWRAGRRAEVQNKSNGPNSNVSSRPGRLRRPNRNKARTTAGQAVAEGCQGAGTAGEWSWGRSEFMKLEPAPGRLGVPLRGSLSLNSVIVGFQGGGDCALKGRWLGRAKLR